MAFSAIPPAPPYVHAKEWTPQQQVEETQRRLFAVSILYQPTEINFTPRPSDVIVATHPKCGTTWLTHICHQLRMGGSEPQFKHHEDVVPIIDIAEMMMGVDPNTAPQPAHPRVFHSHLPYSSVPKGGKLITCMREPKDMLLSLYLFSDAYLSLKGRVPLMLYCSMFIKGGGLKSLFLRLLEWWEHRNDEDVLFLFFDDLKEDHIGCVRRIAKFIGVDCSEEVISRVVFTTTHAEMARHHSKFDASQTAIKFAEILGDDPPGKHVGRVRKDGGKSGEGKTLPEELKQLVDQEWKEVVTEKLGFRNLEEMRQAWKKESSK